MTTQKQKRQIILELFHAKATIQEVKQNIINNNCVDSIVWYVQFADDWLTRAQLMIYNEKTVD